MKQREEIFTDVIVVDNVPDNFIMRRLHGFYSKLYISF